MDPYPSRGGPTARARVDGEASGVMRVPEPMQIGAYAVSRLWVNLWVNSDDAK